MTEGELTSARAEILSTAGQRDSRAGIEPYKSRRRKAEAGDGTTTVQELEPYKKRWYRLGATESVRQGQGESAFCIFFIFLDMSISLCEDRARSGSWALDRETAEKGRKMPVERVYGLGI